MSRGESLDAASGVLLVATMILVILFEWTGEPVFARFAAIGTVGAVGAMIRRVGWSRRAYVLIGAALFLAAVVALPEWRNATAAAFGTASFIAAFFTALMTLRSAAATSSDIERCGLFLARQPPGRRYLALTAGGHLFGLILSYGAISLLGSLAAASAGREADAEIRAHRTRRMLIAIQRGFVSTLPWSPLAFAVAISTTLVPGATWEDAVAPCLVSAAILAGAGWALDTMFKPRLSTIRPSAVGEGRWIPMLSPLLLLLAVLVACATAVRAVADLRIIGVVMTIVPLVALAWIAVQRMGSAGVGRHVAARAAAYATKELPRNRHELVLLVMAGFIGTMGGRLAAQVIPAIGLDLAALPTSAILLGLFWLIPIAGQAGMNPILAASLIAPLLPEPQILEVEPSAVIVAMTGGWALSGATSPFTASTLLIGSLGKVSATHVGLRWNGFYALTSGTLLSFWVLVVVHVG